MVRQSLAEDLNVRRVSAICLEAAGDLFEYDGNFMKIIIASDEPYGFMVTILKPKLDDLTERIQHSQSK